MRKNFFKKHEYIRVMSKGAKKEKMYFVFFFSSFLAVPTVQVEALVGHTTKLPCQMNSTKSSDVFLVLWYVDLDGKPIYR